MKKLSMLVLVLLLGYMLPAQAEAPLRGFPVGTQVFRATAGAQTAYDLTGDRISFDWEVCNENATVTNDLKLQICFPGQTALACASNDAIYIRGSWCYSKKDVPATGFYVTTDTGTPDFQIVAHYN